VVPRVSSQKPVGLAAAGQAPKVCDGHRHFGAGDPVVVRRCPSGLEVHGEVPRRRVADEGVGQRHLESLGGPLAVLVDARPSERAEVGAVEAGVEHVEAAGVVGGEAEGLVVAQGPAVEAFHRRETVGVDAADLGRVAHRGDRVAQRCNETGQR